MNNRTKRPNISNEKNPMWKGDEVSYNCLHKWISRKLGKPNVCWSCGNDKAIWYEWANMSGEYKRDLKDYMRLCRSCHRYFDYKTTARGENNAASKLTEKDVINIRKEYIPYKNSFPKLAEKYNVCHQSIENIIYGITWRHV